MIKVDIHILNQQMDIYKDASYSITRQVNEFTDLTKREFNYTNTYKFPKTVKNRKVMKHLYFQGNRSDVPYIRLDGSSITFNGIPVVQDGYAIIKETAKDYNVVFYEGSLTFFEAIKDLTLRNLDWSDTDHLYDVETMVDSWTAGEKYIYPIIKATENQNVNLIPVTHAVPFVYAKDIFQKMAGVSGITVQGTLLTDPLFQQVIVSTSNGIILEGETTGTPTDAETKFYNYTTQTSIVETDRPTNNVATGYYKLLLKWSYSSTTGTNPSVNIFVNGNPRFTENLTGNEGEKELLVYGSVFEAGVSTNNPAGIQTNLELTLEAFQIDYGNTQVTFSELMPDTPLKTFIRQFLVMFGANVYYDINTRTLNVDLINDFEDAEAQNISRYVSEKKKESYTLGRYSSINEFGHKLNEDQEETGGGELLYGSNLGDRRKYFTTIFAEPRLDDVQYQIYENVLFDDEGKANEGDITIGIIQDVNETIILTPFNGDYGREVVGYSALDYEPVKFDSLLQKYYYFLADRVFASPAKVFYNLTMPVIRFLNLDVTKFVYLEQEASNFLINKIKLSSNGRTTAELIKVLPRNVVIQDPVAVITGRKFFTSTTDETVTLLGTSSYAPSGFITDYYWEIKDSTGTILYTSTKNNVVFNLPKGETYEACLTVTDNRGNSGSVCENIISEVFVEPPIIPIGKTRNIFTDICVTVIETQINGTPNATVDIEVRTTLTNGACSTTMYVPPTTTSNCWLDLCPSIAQVNGAGADIGQVTLDATGTAFVQVAIEGRKDPDAPVANETVTLLKEVASGYTKIVATRQWINTSNC